MADYRRALANRLRDRSDALAEEIFDRLWHLEDGPNLQPPRTFGGLRSLIHSLIEYGAAAIELGEQQCPPPPPAVLDHVRKAAWAAVPAQRLHSGYIAARTVFDQFLRQEARSVEGYKDVALSQIHESNDIVFERLFRIVGEELEKEVEKKRRSTPTQRLARVKALLAGELVKAADLDYELDASHIGIVGGGEDLGAHIRRTTKSLYGSLLLVQPSPQKVWAWISTHSELSSNQVADVLAAHCPPNTYFSLGEPAAGLAGWRRTHHQSQAAFSIALRAEAPTLRYADVARLASIARDTLLSTWLSEMYLAPLSKERDGGLLLRKTLRAYFSTGRRHKSTAAVLRVSRQTISKRLQRVEERIGQPLHSCAPELEAALLLNLFSEATDHQQPSAVWVQ